MVHSDVRFYLWATAGPPNVAGPREAYPPPHPLDKPVLLIQWRRDREMGQGGNCTLNSGLSEIYQNIDFLWENFRSKNAKFWAKNCHFGKTIYVQRWTFKQLVGNLQLSVGILPENCWVCWKIGTSFCPAHDAAVLSHPCVCYVLSCVHCARCVLCVRWCRNPAL